MGGLWFKSRGGRSPCCQSVEFRGPAVYRSAPAERRAQEGEIDETQLSQTLFASAGFNLSSDRFVLHFYPSVASRVHLLLRVTVVFWFCLFLCSGGFSSVLMLLIQLLSL